MNKTEFVNAVHQKNPNLSKTQVKSVVDSVLETIRETTLKGENIVFVGFGTFSTTETVPREGRNPKTGEKVKIAAKKRVVCKLSPTWATTEK